MRGHPVMRGRLLQTLSYLPMLKNLCLKDNLAGILRCPLKTGFTV